MLLLLDGVEMVLIDFWLFNGHTGRVRSFVRIQSSSTIWQQCRLWRDVVVAFQKLMASCWLPGRVLDNNIHIYT